MNYKEIVDKIEAAANQHAIIADFGYGQYSDIKVLDEAGDGADYPYAFLLPTGVSRAQQAVTYSFNLIMMEMAQTPSQILDVQSKCLQYIDDLIAYLRVDTTFEPEVLLTQSTQVFRERFQDEVAGATATINIVAPVPMDACYYPDGSATFGQGLVATPTTVDPDPSGSGLSIVTPPQRDTNGWWDDASPYDAFYVPGNYTYRVTVTGQVEQALPVGGEVVTQTPPSINPHEIINGSPVQAIGSLTPVTTNWPTTYTAGLQQFEVEYEWVAPSTQGTWSLNTTLVGLVGIDESAVTLTDVIYTFQQI